MITETNSGTKNSAPQWSRKTTATAAITELARIGWMRGLRSGRSAAAARLGAGEGWVIIAVSAWGGSSAGRASRSQCEGRGFDPLPLHQFPSLPFRISSDFATARMLRLRKRPRARPFSTIGAETMSNRNSGRPSNPGQQSQRSIGSEDPRSQQTQRSEASHQQSQQGQSSGQHSQQGRSREQSQQGQSGGPRGSRNVRSQVERQDQMSQQGNPGSAPGSRTSSYGMGSQGEGGSERQAGTSNMPGSPNQSGSMGASRRDDDEDERISRR